MYTLEKTATGSDRARARIHVHGEALVPAFCDGMVRVETQRDATVHALRRKGWRVVAIVVQQPSRAEQLSEMTVKDLRKLAKELDVKGRSKMGREDLVAAVVAAESNE